MVELFTAQGCSPCLRVGEFVDQMADRPGLIVLTWSVDYWDYLGWKDTFAEPEFTERQRAYDRRFGLRDVFTPQVIVDGEFQGSGAKPGHIQAMIDRAQETRTDPPQMQFLPGGRVAVGSGRRPRGGGEVWLIRFDPREQDVEIKAGDNRGRTLPERNVVRQLVRLGRWQGRPVVFRAPAAGEEGLASLVLLQGMHGGRILGALATEPAIAVSGR
ncbi:MAG: DUF1223 domain-containing protein [Caulobacteraceae bacterium]